MLKSYWFRLGGVDELTDLYWTFQVLIVIGHYFWTVIMEDPVYWRKEKHWFGMNYDTRKLNYGLIITMLCRLLPIAKILQNHCKL